MKLDSKGKAPSLASYGRPELISAQKFAVFFDRRGLFDASCVK